MVILIKKKKVFVFQNIVDNFGILKSSKNWDYNAFIIKDKKYR